MYCHDLTRYYMNRIVYTRLMHKKESFISLFFDQSFVYAHI